MNAIPMEHRKLLMERKDVTVACGALGVRFRLDAYMQRGSVCGVFKPLASKVPALADLGLPVLLEQLAAQKDGLILVAGPPKSGKTTTLASLVDAINATRRISIFTIEDPIEFYHQDKKGAVSQREVGTDANSFQEALNHALRQQADVVAISELRDAEIMYSTLVAADSGHLMISSLAAPTTVGAIEWVLNSFEGAARETVQMLLASSLRAVVSVRLFPRTDAQGSVAATEILVVNDLVRNYLSEGMIDLLGPLLEAGGAEHLHPFRESVARLQEMGLVARDGVPAPAQKPVAEAAAAEPVQLKLEEARADDTMMGWL
jgi:twitching motility protein PilT